MLGNTEVLEWHTDSLSFLASNRLPTTYAVGTFTMPGEDYKEQGVGKYLRNYEWQHYSESGLSLPTGLSVYVPAPFDLVQLDSRNPHRASLNNTAEDIDSTLIALLPYFSQKLRLRV